MGRRTTGQPRPEQQGFVMLVVMVILLVATATATVAVQSTGAEIRAAGQYRQALQTEHVAEAALVTNLGYVDQLALSGQLAELKQTWDDQDLLTDLPMHVFGEPPLTAETRHIAMRLHSGTHRAINLAMAAEVPPITAEGFTNAFGFLDSHGSLGPNQAYQPTQGPEARNYVVDMDCLKIEGAGAGDDAGGEAGATSSQVRLWCVTTARGRTEMLVSPGGAPVDMPRTWFIAGVQYTQQPFTTAHDSRMIMITAPMPASAGF